MKLGFVGCGNMAGAMMGGIIKNNIFKAEDVYGSDVFEPSRERVKNMYGIHVSDNNVDVVDAVDVLVLAVKPQYYESVITQIKDHVRSVNHHNCTGKDTFMDVRKVWQGRKDCTYYAKYTCTCW